MNRLSHERLARTILDKLLDSGELRSVASDRAVAQIVHYLPPVIALAVPAEAEFADLLNPQLQTRTAEAIAQALTRIVVHEEGQQWVAISVEGLELQVSLREQSRVLRASPIYEPDIAAVTQTQQRLGQPRLRVGWTSPKDDAQVKVFRQRQGLLQLDLGRRAPELWIIEADSSVAAEDGLVAYLVCDAEVRIEAIGEQAAQVVPARTRIEVTHDLRLSLRPAWWRWWQRTMEMTVEVLGLARLGRPDLVFSSSEGEQRRWDRNREPSIELAADLFLHAQDKDQLGVENTGELAAEILWFDGARLAVPAGARVTVQGSHVLGVISPGGTMWASSSGDFQAPPPRILQVVGEVAVPAPASERSNRQDALFRFEQRSAVVFQDAVVVAQVPGDEVSVAVRSHLHAGPIALVALDDCPGAKIAYPKNPTTEAVTQRTGESGGSPLSFTQIHDVVPLGASGARLELVGAAQIMFAVPSFVRTLTTDPDDAWVVGDFKLRVTSEGLDLERTAPGHGHVEVNGVTYPGNARVGFDGAYRVRVGPGLFRIVRDSTSVGDGDGEGESGRDGDRGKGAGRPEAFFNG